MHQRQDGAPVWQDAAAGSPAVRVGREEGDLADSVGVVEACRQRQQADHLADWNVRLQLAADGKGDARYVLRGHLLRLLADGKKNLLLPLRAPEVALQVAVT